MVCKDLKGMGIEIDEKENAERKPGARVISTPNSRIKVLIIPTYWYFSNDETQITYDFLGTWHANQTQDKLYLNLGAFRAWHAAGHPDTGFLTRLI